MNLSFKVLWSDGSREISFLGVPKKDGSVSAPGFNDTQWNNQYGRHFARKIDRSWQNQQEVEAGEGEEDTKDELPMSGVSFTRKEDTGGANSEVDDGHYNLDLGFYFRP